MHDHNEHQRVQQLTQRLISGQSIALISDAGTPLISDPGYHLVSTLRAESIDVIPIPGPCALICALSVAGLPTDRFVFEGFLPAKASQRKARLQSLVHEPRTLVFYESPHRISDSLSDMIDVFGANRSAVVAKELTKKFETIQSGTLDQALNWLHASPDHQKGEFVVLIAGAPAVDQSEAQQQAQHLLQVMLKELSVKQAVKLVAQLTPLSKNEVYSLALTLSKGDSD